MSIQVTPIPRLTVLTVPAYTLGTANAAGSASTAVASNSTLLAFDATDPAEVAASAVVGTAVVASRRDHVHAGVIATSSGVAKAWCRITNAGGLESPDYGVSSVTDHAVGTRTINFTTAFSTSVYTAVATPSTSAAAVTVYFNSFTVNGVAHHIQQSTDQANADVGTSCVFYGDQ